MQGRVNPTVEKTIKAALADASITKLHIEWCWWDQRPSTGPSTLSPPITVIDARRIIDRVRKNPHRFHSLEICRYRICSDAVLNVFRAGLPQCTAVTTFTLDTVNLGNEGLKRLLPVFYNKTVTSLNLSGNNIQGQRGGELSRDLLIGNKILLELILIRNPIGPEGAIGFGQGLKDNHGLQILNLERCRIGNDGLANLLMSMGEVKNSSLLHLLLSSNNIEGADGGRNLTLLLQHFPTLKVLGLSCNNLGHLGARALAPGLAAAASHLETLSLYGCGLGNDGVANLIPDGQVNRSLTNLNLSGNNIQGAEGGRRVSLLLQHFPTLTVLDLSDNRLCDLGARALAPGLGAAISHLERLKIHACGLGNDGVANLIPEGQVNRSLTYVDLMWNNIEGGLEGGEKIVALVSRCTSLDSLDLDRKILSPDQQHRLDMLLNQNHLVRQASALAGSTFPVLFRFVEKAHRHEQGLGAIFVILQNDGDDYFCTALNRAID